ncbi:hypothetical protein PGH07_07315 [Sulfurovum sp. zt1-1]|uniref:Outer membrane protein beta-barrel domain-containing protein n=1 Tax=Sulfurovum zhangzhouensis TaxID=3019067 RepID=A0ABT7QYS0_9BACT|nr:hypothetical protein [Sulfurovum zhangzhouensis]MDM5271983.1 hypothetical protein [Sulfurovum zhangzhouensis]
MNMMMIRTILTGLILSAFAIAQPNSDQDMDGVPDAVDQCSNTPFLDEVNAEGCSTNKLFLPDEEDNDGLDVILGYGLNNNEDILGRETQHTTNLQISYYQNDWSYSIRSGYFMANQEHGTLDTILKIKRKFKLNDTFKLGMGVGIKLPTYDYVGNKTDYTFYGSLSYYPISDYSILAGVNYTFINDIEETVPLQDINAYYIGTGHFFTKNLYASISYSYADSKFTTQHPTKALMGILFYKIDQKWYTTLSYRHEIDDDDLHNAFNIKLGYSIW